jgi:diguanylate cyclase (GGDEF)-like protein
LAVLAWRLNQNRLAAIAAGLAASSAFLVAASAAGRPALDLANAWMFTVPSGLALSLLPKEGALFSARSFGRLALLFLPAVLAWAVASTNPGDLAPWLALRAGPLGGPGQPSLISLLSLALFALALALRLHSRAESALVALGGSLLGLCALAWGLALLKPDPNLTARVWLAGHLAQAACLALGVFLLYWQRVYLDELTGIPNRRALDERLGHLAGDYCLAMVDIDHFKSFNDTYGHAEGDSVLRMVAEHLREHTQNRAFRYGGEEFCVLTPGLETKELHRLMDAARAALAGRRFHIRVPPAVRRKRSAKDRRPGRKDGVQVTFSVGVARRDKNHDSPARVLKLADEGLYDAKAKGRNVVVTKN